MVLQFIEQTACEEEPPEEGQPLLLAALRVLARCVGVGGAQRAGRKVPMLQACFDLCSIVSDASAVANASPSPPPPTCHHPPLLQVLC